MHLQLISYTDTRGDNSRTSDILYTAKITVFIRNMISMIYMMPMNM